MKGDHTEKGNKIFSTKYLDIRGKEMDGEYSSEVLEEDFLWEHKKLYEDVDSCSYEICSDEEESTYHEDLDPQSDGVPNVSLVVSMFQLKQMVLTDRGHKQPNESFDIERLIETEDRISILSLIGMSKGG